MNKYRHLVLLFLLGTTLFSCSSDDDKDDLTIQKDPYVTINASVNGLVQDNSDTQLWAKHDLIGVYGLAEGQDLSTATYKNIRYTLLDERSSLFTPANVYNDAIEFGNEPLQYIMYAPYSESVKDGLVILDIADQSKPSLVDFKTAIKSIENRADNVLEAKFTHQLSKVIVNLTTDSPELNLAPARISLNNVYLKGNYHLTNQKLEAVKDSKGNIRLFIPKTEGNVSGTAFLLPEPTLKDTFVSISVELNGQMTTVKAPWAEVALKANTQYELNIKLQLEDQNKINTIQSFRAI